MTIQYTGDQIKRLRKAASISQGRLADLMREHGRETWWQTTVSRIERGSQEVRDLEDIEALTDIFDGAGVLRRSVATGDALTDTIDATTRNWVEGEVQKARDAIALAQRANDALAQAQESLDNISRVYGVGGSEAREDNDHGGHDRSVVADLLGLSKEEMDATNREVDKRNEAMHEQFAELLSEEEKAGHGVDSQDPQR